MSNYRICDYMNESAWKKGRARGIGGSDASAVIGRNPYKTNMQLFEEKIGVAQAPDISEQPYVVYGHRAEGPIRELFSLDHPEMEVEHHDYRILQSVEHPFLLASLDGELTDSEGRRGVLEIKTTNILQSMQREKWSDQIPENYYIQVLHYLLVTGYDFAILRAHLKSVWKEEIRTSVRDYRIERKEVEDDINYLLQEEIKFWSYVESGRKPALILPEV